MWRARPRVICTVRWRRDDSRRQSFEALERSGHHLLRAPSFESAQRFDCQTDRLEVVVYLGPLVAGYALRLAVEVEVYGHATIVWEALLCVHQAILADHHVATDHHVRSSEKLELSE